MYGFFECTELVAAVGIGALEVVNFADAAPCELLDLATEFNKGITQIICQPLAQR